MICKEGKPTLVFTVVCLALLSMFTLLFIGSFTPLRTDPNPAANNPLQAQITAEIAEGLECKVGCKVFDFDGDSLLAWWDFEEPLGACA